MEQCQYCIFWERLRAGQYMGSCLNGNNYRIRTRFDDKCDYFDYIDKKPAIDMQSQVRG